MKIRSKILIVMGVPFVILGGSTLAMLDASTQTNDAVEDERKAVAVDSAFQQVERDLVDAESATKGYLITGQPGLLGPYADAVARLPRDITALTNLAGGGSLSPDEAQMLRELADQRLSLLQSLQILAPIDDATNHIQLRSLVSSGTLVMDRFQALIDGKETEASWPSRTNGCTSPSERKLELIPAAARATG